MLKRRYFLPVLILLTGCAMLFSGGCRSNEFFQNRAVEAARAYLLENAPELTPGQVAFVQFNDPALLTSQILGDLLEKGREEHTKSALFQYCIAWNIPEAKNLYLVFGVSDARMISWSPRQLIRKTFPKKTMPENAAIALCRQFALNSLYHSLTPVQLNHIRFDFPFIAWTDFELNYNPDGKKTAEEIQEARENEETRCQYSLYWKNPDGSATVFCGTSQADLSGWRLNFAGHVTRKDLEKHTKVIVRTPGDNENNIKLLDEVRSLYENTGSAPELSEEEPENKDSQTENKKTEAGTKDSQTETKDNPKDK